MEVTQPHNSTINNSHFNRRLSSNTNFNAIPNLGRSSLPQKDKEWITTRYRDSCSYVTPWDQLKWLLHVFGGDLFTHVETY